MLKERPNQQSDKIDAAVPKKTTTVEKTVIACVRFARGSARKKNGNRQPIIPASRDKDPFAFRTDGRLIRSNTITTLINKMVAT
jgi:hypothetical protein